MGFLTLVTETLITFFPVFRLRSDGSLLMLFILQVEPIYSLIWFLEPRLFSEILLLIERLTFLSCCKALSLLSFALETELDCLLMNLGAEV